MSTSKVKLPSLSVLGPVVALVLACVFFSFQHERFFTLQNFSLILQQIMVVATIAIGQTLIILTAGIDLSCGMIMALGSIVMTKVAADFGLPAPVAILIGVTATAAVGAVNGWLVSKAKLPPFIVTLGMFNIAFAITQLYSRAQTIVDIPEGMLFLGETFALGGARIAYGGVLVIFLYVLTWLFLRETAPGRHVYAVGNNPEATRLTGIPTEKVIFSVYVFAGIFYGLAAMLAVARTGAGDPNAGQTENLDAITAVVLGGTSLFGGRGLILGSLLGAFIVGVFRNGLTLMGVSSVYQLLVTGILVILAVAADRVSSSKARG